MATAALKPVTEITLAEHKAEFQGQPRKDKNKFGGFHAEWTRKHPDTGADCDPSFTLRGWTKFGVCEKKTNKAESEKKEGEKTYGYQYPLQKNTHLVPFCEVTDEMAIREIHKNSQIYSGRQMSLEAIRDGKYKSCMREGQNAENVARYGKNLKVNVDNNTLYVIRDKNGKDRQVTRKEVENKEGYITTHGKFNKINLQGDYTVILLAELVILEPSVVSLDKFAGLLNLKTDAEIKAEEAAAASASASASSTTTATVTVSAEGAPQAISDLLSEEIPGVRVNSQVSS